MRRFQGGQSNPIFHVQTEAGACVLRTKAPGKLLPAMDCLIAWRPVHLPKEHEAALAHGDFRLGNLILHPTGPRIVAVLDRELCTIGRPLANLGYTCLTYDIPPGPGGIAGTLGTDRAGAGIPTEHASEIAQAMG